MNKEISETEKKTQQRKTCGIIMPIAPHQDYPTDHWKDVLGILTEAIRETEFEPKLVSDDVAVGLIHDRIVTNIYNNEIVVCDVSSKNPNVMFELGLRLAFDKPTIIIKDESTGYSFDTGVIEHIPYPSSLRFSQIVKFKEELIRRINATYAKSNSEPNYSPFLKSFGKTIIATSLKQTEIPEGKFILEQLERIRMEVKTMRAEQRNDLEIRQQMGYSFQDKFTLAIPHLERISTKYPLKEILNNPELNTVIRNDLAQVGVHLTRSELKDVIMNMGLRLAS